MVVLKFGGTSVASLDNIKRIQTILDHLGSNYIVAVSAISGVTDLLHQLADASIKDHHHQYIEQLVAIHSDLINQLFTAERKIKVLTHIQDLLAQLKDICHSIYIIQERSPKILARIQSFGEIMSSYILGHYFQSQGLNITLKDGRELIRANGNYLKAEVDMKATRNLISQLDQDQNYIVSGFISRNENGETTLLGRGGTDYTAAILAAGIGAERLEIWSDVNGMQNANPRIVKEAQPIQQMSYKEAFEMAFFGAKVLYPPTIKPVMDSHIPLYLKNTFHPEQAGTHISELGGMDDGKIKGVSSLTDISIINITGIGLAKEKGMAKRVFQALEDVNVNVILITQSCSEQSICLGVSTGSVSSAEQSIRSAFEKEISIGLVNTPEISNDQCIIAVVGDHMKNTIGLSGKMFSALGQNGINIKAIAQGASERNISLVVNKKDESKAINVIHQKFFQKAIKQVHLYIAGVGNVGNQFLKVIKKQKELLHNEKNIEIKIMGIANSKKMVFDNLGLTDSSIKLLNKNGSEYHDFNDFVTIMKEQNLSNSIFVDNTASEIVSASYHSILDGSISLVACNKIACSSSIDVYNQLQKTAKEKNVSFRYETTVGAALPIISTIKDIMLSGDRINSIEAVLSGSLNFIFNAYDATSPFADIVKLAMYEGYTEPNPYIDLSGLDVMRKIIILAREAGYNKEVNDVSFNGFLPKSCTTTSSNDEFYTELLKHESYFSNIYHTAHAKNNRLKVVAQLNEGQLSVELREVPPESPFYHLEGKDNIVAMHTARYSNEPIIIKGAGAGAEVTASGVFSDVMKVINV